MTNEPNRFWFRKRKIEFRNSLGFRRVRFTMRPETFRRERLARENRESVRVCQMPVYQA